MEFFEAIERWLRQRGWLPGAAPASGIPELLSPGEAAQALGVSEGDVIATLEAGDLKGKKIGSTWRITRAAIDAFLAE